jgi:hypothetical protein
MIQRFGDFKEEPVNSEEYLELGFSPSSMPLKHRWRNNGLSADFLGDYLTNFFPTSETDEPNNIDKQAEIKCAVSYIANELLENAMKFNDETSQCYITIKVLLHKEHIILYLTNSVSPQNVSIFQAYLQELTHFDPQELYIKQLEHNAQDENGMTSRLGILTMINDYMVKLGWKFETIRPKQEVTVVTTMVQFSV